MEVGAMASYANIRPNAFSPNTKRGFNSSQKQSTGRKKNIFKFSQ